MDTSIEDMKNENNDNELKVENEEKLNIEESGMMIAENEDSITKEVDEDEGEEDIHVDREAYHNTEDILYSSSSRNIDDLEELFTRIYGELPAYGEDDLHAAEWNYTQPPPHNEQIPYQQPKPLEPEDEYHSLSEDSDEEVVLEKYKSTNKETENLYKEEDAIEREPKLSGELHLVEGMMWDTVVECRKYLREYAIQNRFEARFLKNENYRVRLVCRGLGCKWLCYCRLQKDGFTFKLKTLQNTHTCNYNADSRNMMANALWVANTLEKDMRLHHRSYKPRDIVAEVWEKHQVKISYWTAWHARDIILERVNGSYEDSFSLTPELCKQILTSNPGSIAKVSIHPADKEFLALTICFVGSLKGFTEGCRPLLGLDGCFLKGKYQGVCLSICGIDANNSLFPIAICICRKESYVTWKPFLEMMEPKLSLHPAKLTFISDMQKGLIEAVKQVFPHSSHRFCFRHISMNYKKIHKGNHLMTLAWSAAKAFRPSEHKMWMETLKKEAEKAYEWLVKKGVNSWARSTFEYSTNCEHISNNFSESFNNWILDLRDKPIVTFVEKFHLMLMVLLTERRLESRKLDPEGVSQRAESIIDEYKKLQKKYTYQGSNDSTYCVQYRGDKRWTVNIQKMTCDCCVWQLTGIPCVHAVAVLEPRRPEWTKYCSHFHSAKSLMKTYAGAVIPMSSIEDWGTPTFSVLPPPLERLPGRPRHQRIRDEEEDVKKKQRQCSRCKQLGHNVKTCKGGPTAAQARNANASARSGATGSREREISRGESTKSVVGNRATTPSARGGKGASATCETSSSGGGIIAPGPTTDGARGFISLSDHVSHLKPPFHLREKTPLMIPATKPLKRQVNWAIKKKAKKSNAGDQP